MCHTHQAPPNLLSTVASALDHIFCVHCTPAGHVGLQDLQKKKNSAYSMRNTPSLRVSNLCVGFARSFVVPGWVNMQSPLTRTSEHTKLRLLCTVKGVGLLSQTLNQTFQVWPAWHASLVRGLFGLPGLT